MITLIAACSNNRVIGKDNQLIWHVPGDLKRFKELTTGHNILMGRKTFESIGKPLPNRRNIIITRDRNYHQESCFVYNSLEEALEIYRTTDLFVIGGAEIYKQTLGYADAIELTLIDKDFEGDAYFPEIPDEYFTVANKVDLSCPDFDYSYIRYKKI